MLCFMRYDLAEVHSGAIDRPSVYITYIRRLILKVKVLYYIYSLLVNTGLQIKEPTSTYVEIDSLKRN